MPLQVVVVQGPDTGRAWMVRHGQSLEVGRGTQTPTRLRDPSVSRVHCELFWDGPSAHVRDSNSGAGTFVNGEPVEVAPLNAGDRILIGDTLLRVDRPDQDSAGPSDMSGLDELQAFAAELMPASAPADDTVRVRRVRRPKPERPLNILVGQSISGWRIEQELARGETGTVFRAVSKDSGTVVALKVLWPELTADASERKRFERAVHAARPIRHPNLVEVLDAGVTRVRETGTDLCWFTMEYVDGYSLRAVLDSQGVAGMLDWQHAWRIAVHIGRALQVAHSHRVVHRNITPENILLPKAERTARLGDWMLALALEGNAREITRRGELIGWIQYMAPERTRGEKGDHRSDLYSLGVTLYVALTGQLPFDALKVAELAAQIQSIEPVPPRTAQRSIDEGFESIVMRLMAKDPAQRFQSAVEMLAGLEDLGAASGLAAVQSTNSDAPER